MTDSTAVVKYTKAMTKPVQSAEAFGTLLEANRQELSGLIPGWSGLAWAHVVATALEVASENTAILACSADSVLRSVKTACEFGLSFAKAGGQAYLVPFKGQCTLIIGYRGLMDLARRSADVTTLQSGVVYQGDVYEPHLGSDPHIVHTPSPEAEHADDKIVAAYSIAKHRSGEQTVETMPLVELKAIRKRSRSRDRQGVLKGPWVTDFSEMCRKTVERRHLKRLSWRAEDKAFMERVIAHDNATAGIEDATALSPENRLKRMHALLAGETEPIEGEVVPASPVERGVQPEAEGVPPSQPPQEAPPPALDALRNQITDLCTALVDKAKEEGKPITTARLVETASKQTLKKVLGLGQMDAAQLVAVRDRLEKWCKEKGVVRP